MCQQRALKKENSPGKWEAFFGGHVRAGESYEVAAVKEVAEETGIHFSTSDLDFFTKVKSDKPTAKHFQSAFYAVWNGTLGKVHIEQEEVEKVEWKAISVVEDILLVQKDQNWVYVIYEQAMVEYLKNLPERHS